MKLHEIFRLQYRTQRYMEHLSAVELEQRFKDVLLNQLVLTEENKIGLNPMNQEGKYWIRIFTHLCEEFKIRYGPFPAGFKNGFLKDMRIPSPSMDAATKACNAINNKKLNSKNLLFKYGESRYLEQTLKNGIIRISPATSFNSVSLNSAIHDDELEFVINPNTSKIKFEAFDNKTGKSKGKMNIKHAQITHKSATDYYVYCMSSIFVPRLFLDFGADACLIIKNPEKFTNKLLKTFEKQYSNWFGILKKVTYLDPIRLSSHKVDIFSIKHFRYAYQKEIRLIWLPSSKPKKLYPKFIKLGNLSDICEIINI